MSVNLDVRRVTDLFHVYADALDRRDWAWLDDVFLEDVRADYNGTEVVAGRAALTGMIRGYLDGCGPTQHLMGNARVVVDGDRAEASVKMRVHHVGAAERAELTYECFGWYHAELIRTARGWRVASWRQEVTHQLGTFDVFARV
ncbi:nuclear transport factor 2 family protein [Streptomyces sp. NBC_00963]|uniref:nuclear transport factor 2 family protein n=1 Tax=unclassified Streptomyces TaxID=2593676 RepID=UPI00225A4BCC|nr:nuclear transport factor 2 family protein [Streptomyces sp. NBC_01306]MCX4725831.1 nuclear transport factor 2 family protein [Streptomyces sp. NBC_01306]WSX42884.1 nuclear transport factor 2 family protein [Streptomyces sp. NBC_00963]